MSRPEGFLPLLRRPVALASDGQAQSETRAPELEDLRSELTRLRGLEARLVAVETRMPNRGGP